MVLALVFLVAIGLVLSVLVSLTGTNLLDTTNLQNQRNLEFAADTAVDGAIVTLRHQAPSPPSNPNCPNFQPTPPTDNTSVVVECTMGIPAGFYGRLVEFDACPAGAVSFAACQSDAVVKASVIFNDVSNAPGCTSGSMAGCYGNSWGTGMTLESWVVEPANG